jgi:hypothetical protein
MISVWKDSAKILGSEDVRYVACKKLLLILVGHQASSLSAQIDILIQVASKTSAREATIPTLKLTEECGRRP